MTPDGWDVSVFATQAPGHGTELRLRLPAAGEPGLRAQAALAPSAPTLAGAGAPGEACSPSSTA